MPLTITKEAAEKVAKFREDQNVSEEQYLRIGIGAGGCSGFSYVFQFDEKFDEEKDTKMESNGVEYVVDKKSALYLDEVTVGWHESAMQQGFTFDNPNAVKSCGCGSSFSV
ncbi:MAG: iron-sulfur cluster assembly accessory protein [Planctomycetota bacterium]